VGGRAADGIRRVTGHRYGPAPTTRSGDNNAARKRRAVASGGDDGPSERCRLLLLDERVCGTAADRVPGGASYSSYGQRQSRVLQSGDCESGDRERQRSEAGSERPPVPMQDAGTGPAGGAAARPRRSAEPTGGALAPTADAGVLRCPGCRHLIGRSSGGSYGTRDNERPSGGTICRHYACKGFPLRDDLGAE
jgi:hypothetical protein